MWFSRQEYWSGSPFPSVGDLPNPGIQPRSPALQANSLLMFREFPKLLSKNVYFYFNIFGYTEWYEINARRNFPFALLKWAKWDMKREKKMLIIDFSILCWIFFLSWSEEQVLNGLRARAPFYFLVWRLPVATSKFSLILQQGEKFLQMCDPECYLDLLLMQKIKPVPFQTFCQLLDKTLHSLGLFICL